MNKKSYMGIIIFLVMSSPFIEAATFNYTADNRYVNSRASDPQGYSNVTWYPSTPYADWSRPDQTSSLNLRSFSASGNGDLYSDYDVLYVTKSYFDISFNLDTYSELKLFGSLWGDIQNGGYGNASIYLYDDLGTVLYSNAVSTTESSGAVESSILYSAILNPGDYRILATADPKWANCCFQEFSYSSYSLQATLTSVPLPAAVWLFGSGLIGLIGIARRKANA